MRATIWITLMVVACSFVEFGSVYAADVNVAVGVSTNDFTFLGNFGNWVNTPQYGRAWRPSVAAGWSPFTHGEWVWSNHGWTWVSYEPYGWAVYHYGNWHYEPAYGWYWIAGNEWSPARVSWIAYGDHVGWTPLPPRGVVRPDPWVSGRVRYWNLVHAGNLTRENVHGFVLRSGIARPAASIRVVRVAPEIHHIERVTKKKVSVVQVKTVNAGKLKRIEVPASFSGRLKTHSERVERDVIVKQKTQVKAQGKKTTTKEKTTVKSKDQDKNKSKNKNNHKKD